MRYTGARLRIARSLKTDLPGLTRKSSKRQHAPGQHGPTKRRKENDYLIRLLEKQKVRFNYGLSERQLRRFFSIASRSKHETGKQLLIDLESRLDNVVFRAGFAPTIPAARQLVTHGHVLINGRRLNIPSYRIKKDDVISIAEKSRTNPLILEIMQKPSLEIPAYLTVQPSEFSAKVIQLPMRDDVPLDVQENLIVEFYSRTS